MQLLSSTKCNWELILFLLILVVMYYFGYMHSFHGWLNTILFSIFMDNDGGDCSIVPCLFTSKPFKLNIWSSVKTKL